MYKMQLFFCLDYFGPFNSVTTCNMFCLYHSEWTWPSGLSPFIFLLAFQDAPITWTPHWTLCGHEWLYCPTTRSMGESSLCPTTAQLCIYSCGHHRGQHAGFSNYPLQTSEVSFLQFTSQENCSEESCDQAEIQCQQVPHKSFQTDFHTPYHAHHCLISHHIFHPPHRWILPACHQFSSQTT